MSYHSSNYWTQCLQIEEAIKKMMEKWRGENAPGSIKAAEKGCTCSSELNMGGRGCDIHDGGMFIVSYNCPMHAKLLKPEGNVICEPVSSPLQLPAPR